MKKQIKKILSAAILFPALILSVGLFAQPVFAASTTGDCELTVGGGADCAGSENQPPVLFGEDGMFKRITDVLLFLVGAISVIMLIIGGIRYVVSGGDSTAVQNAKNTILYAIVGIVVAILAFAIVSWVNGQFSGQ